MLLACLGLAHGAAAARANSSSPKQVARQALQSRTDYEIDAKLEDARGRMTGREHIRWTNRSADRVELVKLHLYLNAFANTASTHVTEAKGALRGVQLEDGWGWTRLTSARAGAGAQAVDVLATLRFDPSAADASEDRTVAELRLPRAVEPGEVLELELAWEAQLPRVRRRTGVKGDFMLVAQWFPKLGVYESGSGWNCQPFHAHTEFYSDYGTYRVTLDMPAEYEGKLGGGGVQVQSLRKSGERVEVRFESPSPDDRRTSDSTGRERVVHDFTWTADPDYVVVRERFRWRDWAEEFSADVDKVRAALGGEEPTGRDVEITLLMQPEHADQADRHYRATCAALFFYGLWFGEYPYEHITVVDPAWGAGAAGGMEYPTLFTCGTSMFARADSGSPEGVTVHECGHQFWYGLVGNDEVNSAWLDEGFNSFTDSEVMQRVYGSSRISTRYAALPFLGASFAGRPGGSEWADLLAGNRIDAPFVGSLRLLRASGLVDVWRDQPWLASTPQTTSAVMSDRVGYLRSPSSDAIDTSGWRYVDQESYRNNSYPRTAVALRTLKGLVGDAAFARGMRHYARTWRYAHPRPDDFFAGFQEGDGIEDDLGWYFEHVFRGTDGASWSVSAENRRAEPAFGMFPSADGSYVLREKPKSGLFDRLTSREPAAESAPSSAPAGSAALATSATATADATAATGATSDASRWISEVTLRRNAPIALPLTLRLTFDSGAVRDEVWTREEQRERAWKRWTFEGTDKLRAAELDPERRCMLDADLSDNQWYADDPAWTPSRYGERAFSHWAHQLAWYAGLGG